MKVLLKAWCISAFCAISSFGALLPWELHEILMGHETGMSSDEREWSSHVSSEINSNWPSVYSQLVSIIQSAKLGDPRLRGACDLLEPKIIEGDRTYRDTLLSIRSKMRNQDKALNLIFFPVFQRCCTHDDIPFLLDAMASNINLRCKSAAAMGLARVGDASTLKEMQRIHAELTANEPARSAAERKAWVAAIRIIEERQDVVVPQWKPKYLDKIASEIKKLEARLNAQASISVPSLSVNTIPVITKNQPPSTKPVASVFQSESSEWKILFSVCMSLLFGGGIAWYLRKKKRS